MKRKKRKNKKRKNDQQLNENKSMTQQEKRETVVIESDQNTITSFDETQTQTQQHSQLINQVFILHKSTNQQTNKHIFSSSQTFDV
jgi:hypothetical protein